MGYELNEKVSFAIHSGNVVKLKDALRKVKPKELNKFNNGDTLLTEALRQGNPDNLQKLIDAGADVNCTDRYGENTPLKISLKSNSKEVVRK